MIRGLKYEKVCTNQYSCSLPEIIINVPPFAKPCLEGNARACNRSHMENTMFKGNEEKTVIDIWACFLCKILRETETSAE